MGHLLGPRGRRGGGRRRKPSGDAPGCSCGPRVPLLGLSCGSLGSPWGLIGASETHWIRKSEKADSFAFA
eukprot:1116467-Pyramimonas_sp.AAC.1